jgi:hypothetical protein
MDSFNDTVADPDRALSVDTILRSQRNRLFEDSCDDGPSIEGQETEQQTSQDQCAWRWHTHLSLSQDIGPVNPPSR